MELWQLITLLLAFFSCVGVFGKVLLDQTEKSARSNAQPPRTGRERKGKGAARHADRAS